MCKSCIVACPAQTLPFKRLEEHHWKEIKGTFIVSSKDRKMRFTSSSGGVARTLVKGSLEKEIVDSAYTLRRTREYPWAEGTFWKEFVDIATMPNSVYLPILAYENFRPDQKKGNFLLVGTNCQLIGARNILGKEGSRACTISLCCKQQKTLGFALFVAKRLGIVLNRESSEGISFRGEGWPGRIRIGCSAMDWEDAAGLPYGKKLWRVPGCRFCPNPAGADVDLTLADPWQIYGDDKVGSTLVIAWTKKGIDLLRNNEDLLDVGTIGAESAKESIGWPLVQKRQSLVDHYMKKNTTFRTNVIASIDDFTISLMESVLSRYRLPKFMYKVLGHLPNMENLL